MTEDLQFLEEQQVSPKLIREVEKFREAFWIPEEVRNRIVKPPIPFYGKEILGIPGFIGQAAGENG